MTAKKTAKAPAKAAAKPAKKAAKPAAKAAPKPAAKPKASAKSAKPMAQAPAIVPGPLSSMGKSKPDTPEPLPAPKVDKLAEGVLCQIEVLKDGHFFIARTLTDTGQAKEYKNTVFEDMLTEMLITLQEQLVD